MVWDPGRDQNHLRQDAIEPSIDYNVFEGITCTGGAAPRRFCAAGSGVAS